ncbi:MAG: hypothetical protein QXW98_04580 [Candidatus Caldarchaeum sp.]
MLQAGVAVVLMVYAFVAVALLGGFYFLYRITDGNFVLFRRVAGLFFRPFYDGRVAVVVLFLGVGFMLFLMAPVYQVHNVTTGYRYVITPVTSSLRYVDNSCSYSLLGYPSTGYSLGGGCSFVERYTSDRAVVGINVIEVPVQTTIVGVVNRPEYVLGGLLFIVLGLLLAAVFLVRVNNRLAEVVESLNTAQAL